MTNQVTVEEDYLKRLEQIAAWVIASNIMDPCEAKLIEHQITKRNKNKQPQQHNHVLPEGWIVTKGDN